MSGMDELKGFSSTTPRMRLNLRWWVKDGGSLVRDFRGNAGAEDGWSCQTRQMDPAAPTSMWYPKTTIKE